MQMTVEYNLRVAPHYNTNVKGVLWYQGEGNSDSCNEGYYTEAMKVLVAEWSKCFGSTATNLPFVFCNIAPYNYTKQYVSLLNERMADYYYQNPDKCALVPNYDLSLEFHPQNHPIHPSEKTPIGNRCAEAAMGLAYGRTTEYMAPIFDSATVVGDKMHVKFKKVGWA